MNEFSLAIQSGMNAAKIIEQQRLEIKTVLRELADAIEQATTGAATIAVVARSVNSDNELLQGLAFMLSKEKYKALILKGLKHSPPKTIEVARWGQGNTGYPCKIAIASDEYICSDKESLKSVLSKIFRAPQVGLAIAEITKSQLKKVDEKAVALNNVKMPLKTRNKSIANEVFIKPALGKVIEEPFFGKTIRVVSMKKMGDSVVKRTIPTLAKKARTPPLSKDSMPSTMMKKTSKTKAANASETAVKMGSPANLSKVKNLEKETTGSLKTVRKPTAKRTE